MSTTVSSRFFSLEEYAQRWHRVQQAMQQRGLDLVVVWSRSAGTYDRCADLLYLANYYGNQPGQGRNGPQGFSAVVLQVGQTPELFADMQDLRHELIATDRVQASTCRGGQPEGWAGRNRPDPDEILVAAAGADAAGAVGHSR
jgi:hypothetical protein